MIAGPARSGKSALANSLNGEERPLKRTLDTSYRPRTLEVPSAYLENTWMYQHLIALAQDAWCILVLVDQENPQPLYSPGFAQIFRCPVVGVISKCDLAPQNRALVERQLAEIGVEVLPEGTYLCMSRWGMPYEPEGIRAIVACMDKHALQPIGNAFDFCYLDTTSYDESHQEDFCCIQIPVALK